MFIMPTYERCLNKDGKYSEKKFKDECRGIVLSYKELRNDAENFCVINKDIVIKPLKNPTDT